MIDWKEKIVIIHPPRCGGTSIESALGFTPHLKANIWDKHRSAMEIVDEIHEKGESPLEFRWYGLVRNPFLRIQSMLGRGYWDNQTLFPFQQPNQHNHLYQMQFAALLKPTTHEGKNLYLIDFYDLTDDLENQISIELYDTIDIEKFAEKLGINKLSHQEKTTLPVKRTCFMHRCIIYARFRKDFKKFHYPVSIIYKFILPFSLFLIITFKSLHWLAWKFKGYFN